MGDRGRRSLWERVGAAFDLPAECIPDLPLLELAGDGDLYLAGYGDILAYSRTEICVDGGRWLLRLTGSGLEIRAMRTGELRIVGRVERIELV